MIQLFMWQGSSAQTVFAPQGAVWHYYLDGDGTGSNSKFEVEKDTLYKGLLCAKVLRNGSKNATYFYTSGDTVLYYHDSLKSFTPLYIFNVKVGDNISIVAPPPFYGRFADTARFTIKKIDTIIIDGLPLRTVYTNQLDYFYFLPKYTERIGGYSGIDVLCIDAVRTADHSVGIRCYRDKEIDEKFVFDKWDCDYVPNIIDEKTLAKKIHIYPNPAIDEITIEVKSNTPHGQITLKSFDGRTLLQQSLQEIKTVLNLRSIASGMYLLEVKNEQSHFSQKVMVEAP